MFLFCFSLLNKKLNISILDTSLKKNVKRNTS